MGTIQFSPGAVVLALLVLSVTEARDYGKIQPLETVMPTQCASVVSFHKFLRSSPKLEAPDRYVGYIDLGRGMPRGHVFVIAAVKFDAAMSVGELLAQADQRRNPFWAQAELTAGSIELGKPFEAYLPPDKEEPSPGVTIVKRDAMLARGQLYAACGKTYLLVVYGNPLIGEEREWKLVRSDFDTFVSHVRWPE